MSFMGHSNMHSQSNDRVFMIKRKTFAITVSKETMEELNRLSDKFV
jgi:hypothetical protein